MIQLNLSSEDKLLLYCSRINMTEDIKQKVEGILSEALDWNYIVDYSQNQGISPLVYWNLSKVGNSKYLPYDIMKSLERIYYSTLAQNMLFYDELNKILKAFKEVDIDVVVLKGAFLAKEVYKNIGLRPMSDIDLLIREEDYQKAKNELIKLMYSTDVFLTKYYEQLHTVLSNELLFKHKDRKVCIDLHWDILPPESCYKIDIVKLWENTKQVKIDGIETLILTSEDLLMHLCLHLDNHINYYWSAAQHFKDYCDIAEVTKYYEQTIDWNHFLQRSKEYNIEKPIFHCLTIAYKYFGALVPEKILNALQPANFSIDYEKTCNEVIQDNLDNKDQWNKIKYFSKLERVDSNWYKFQLVFGCIFPSKEFMIYYYSIENEKKIYRYYLIHSGKVIQEGLPCLWKLPNYIFRYIFSK